MNADLSNQVTALLSENQALRAALERREGQIDAMLHDLRNPLTAVLSGLVALTSPELAVPEALRPALLENALNGARRLEALLAEQEQRRKDEAGPAAR